MTDYANDPNYPSIKPSPVKSPWLQATSNFLRGAKNVGNKAEIPDWMPLIGGEGVGDLLLGNSDREVGKWAMGSSPFSENRSGLGSKIPMLTDARKKDVADVVTLGMDVAPLIKPAAQGGKWLAKEGAKEAALHIANGMNGEGILAKPLAGASPMNIMAGRNAKLARHDMLSEAERRLAAGDDAATVWKDTGWGRAPDGEMRFEIPDNPAGYSPNKEYFRQLDGNAGRISDAYAAREMKGYIDANGATPQQAAEWFAQREGREASPAAVRKSDSGFTLSDLTDHLRISKNGVPDFMKLGSRVRNIYDNPELFANYPQLGDMQMKFKPGSKLDGAWGQYDGKNISLQDKVGWDPKYGHSTLEHELTHGVQHIEGFQGGSNPKHIAQNPHMYSSDAKNVDPMSAYKRVYGEADARLSQARIGMTPEQRSSTYPFDPDYFQKATGVHPDELIFKNNGNNVVSDSRGNLSEKNPISEALRNTSKAPIYNTEGVPINQLSKSEQTKYDKALKSSPEFRRMEKMRNGDTVIDDVHQFSEPRILQYEDLLGKRGIPIHGDRTAAGKILRRLNGVDIPGGVSLDGGSGYAHMHGDLGTGYGWASMSDAAQKKQTHFKNAAHDTDTDVMGIYTSMGMDGLNFSHMPSEAMIKILREMPMNKSMTKQANSEIKHWHNSDKFVGLDSSAALDQVLGQNGFPMEGAGALRKALIKTLSKAEYQKAGAPNYFDMMNAMTDKGLGHDIPLGTSGYAVIKGKPDASIITGESIPEALRHKTYNTVIPGDYQGRMVEQIPDEIMFPSVFKRMREAEKTGLHRAFSIGNKDYQDFNEPWLEGVLNHLRQTGKK